MKTLIATLTAVAVLGVGAQKVSAGDREWATAGKILTGLVIGGAVARALEPPPPPVYAPAVVYTAPAPVVYASPAPPAPVVVAAPAPVVYAQPTPVVVYPAPAYYVRPAPVYCGPGPFVGLHFSFGGGHHHHRGWR